MSLLIFSPRGIFYFITLLSSTATAYLILTSAHIIKLQFQHRK